MIKIQYLYLFTIVLFFISLIFNYHFLCKKQSLEIFNEEEEPKEEQPEQKKKLNTNIKKEEKEKKERRKNKIYSLAIFLGRINFIF